MSILSILGPKGLGDASGSGVWGAAPLPPRLVIQLSRPLVLRLRNEPRWSDITMSERSPNRKGGVGRMKELPQV
jgi:hypothetical protein